MSARILSGALSGLIAIAAAGLTTNGAAGATFKVDCDKNQTIQHRLDKAASPGDTLQVSGTCVENVTIRVPGITLAAQPGARILAADANLPVVFIVSQNVRIGAVNPGMGNGFTIRGGQIGVDVRQSASAHITDSVIESNVIGIQTSHGSSSQIENNRIRDNGFDANANPIQRGSGVFVGYSSSAVIVGNVIEHNGEGGVRVANTSSARLGDNTIMNNVATGIDVTLNSSVRLSDPAVGGPVVANRIFGNGNYGWSCRINSSIWPFINQDFTGGNAPLNSQIEPSCVKQGPFF